MIKFINYENYKDRIEEILDEYGFVIINGILDNNEIKLAKDLLLSDLLRTIDFNKLNEMEEKENLLKTIKEIKRKKIFPQQSLPGLTGKGFLSTHGLPHGEFAWNLRMNSKCRKIYEYLHKSEDLVVSMDLPFYTNIKNSKTGELWPHADQVITCIDRQSYQGILYVGDANTNNSANTVVLPKSHKNEYNVLLENCAPTTFGNTVSQALYIDKLFDSDLRNTLMTNFIENSRRVQMNAGSLLIFLSTTVHQGFPNGPRIAQTICWEEKKYRSEDAYISKLIAVNKGVGTTHWASLGIHHGATNLRAKKPGYSNDFHECVFPMKKIKSYPTYNEIENISKKPIEDLEKNIIPEILEVL